MNITDDLERILSKAVNYYSTHGGSTLAEKARIQRVRDYIDGLRVTLGQKA